MHPAAAFKVEDAETLLAWVARHPFMMLAAAPAGRPLIAHAPVVVRRLQTGLALDFHLSRGNALAGALAGGLEGVLAGLGPDAYVSPDWYVSADQVPTWNYVCVEAEGPVRALDGEGLTALLDDLSSQEEARLAPKRAWTRAKMSDGVFERMARGIIGARLTVRRLEGTWKLSQNKGEADRAGVVQALGDHPLSALMKSRS